MTLTEKQTIFAKMLAKLILKADELKTPVKIVCLFRSPEQQQRLVLSGASKTLNSKHLDGLAADIVFKADAMDDGKINWVPDKYKALGEYWESIGGRWGGRFGDNLQTATIEGWDAGHFEFGG